MVKRSKKDLSKRMTLRRKFSIQRHVRNHNRDMRRAVKRNVESGLRMTQNKYAAEKAVLRLSNKDTSKKEFLQKTLEARHQIVEKKKLERKKKAKEFDPVVVVRRRAKEKAQEKLFALRKLQKATEDADFFLQLDKCLQHVDMLLIALDARCPLACYSSFLRTAAASHARPHWCIFTKTDLVPPEVLEKWFTYFQAHTDAVEVLSNDPTLLVARIQKHYGVNHKVRVLFAGLPNVGIETFCNAVTQTQAGSVSVHPSKELGPRGHIPYSQTISLLTLPRDAQIRSTAILGPEVLFRNWKFIVHNITDVELHAEDILRHFPAERIARHYRMALLPSSEATHHQPNPEPAQLLALLQKRRTLRDIREAARLVLLDFHQGKLPWCCVPPAISSTKNEATSATVLVREPWTVLDESFLHTLDYEISSKK